MATFSTTNKAPGVYIQEITIPGPIPGVSTSNTAFVGPAAMGPLNQPTLLTNLDQFTAIFGSYIEDPYRVYVTHAVKGFFDEGGGVCYFVRVGTGVQGSLTLNDSGTTPQPTLVVTAIKEGDSSTTKVQVDPASIVSSKAAKASATPKSTAADKRSIDVTNPPDAATFKPGDIVVLNQAPNKETAIVSSINGATITFQSPLGASYTAGTISTTLSAGQQKLRVDSAVGFEPGTYITLDDGTTQDSGVVRLVNSLNGVVFLTLANGLTQSFDPIAKDVTVKSVEFSLTITSPSAGTESFPNLAMDPNHSHYFGTMVTSKAVTVALPNTPSTNPPPKNVPAKVNPSQPLANGKADNLATITTVQYHTGIDTLKKITDVNLLCVPDAVSDAMVNNAALFGPADTQDIHSYMVAHCEKMQDRFAILDSRRLAPGTVILDAVMTQRQGLNSDNGYGALYFPWIAISNPFAKGRIFVPPSGHTAGVFAKNDDTIGVFKAPANEAITSALALEFTVTDDEQGVPNEAGVNVIRSFPGQGIKIWGARTIAPHDVTAWRYVNVRRLVTFIEKSIQEATRFAVFEPNNLTLWQQIKRMVTDFLTDQWSSGALFGTTPEQAFRVRVDETLNPPETRALGQLIVEVTVVPTTPAEFIVFRVVQDITGSTLKEKSA
jgi:uncharacterized protein